MRHVHSSRVTPAPGLLAAAALQAPVAARRAKQLEQHGDVREDPYYWLRDDERQDPEVPAPQPNLGPGAALPGNGWLWKACTLPKVAGMSGMDPIPNAGCLSVLVVYSLLQSSATGR